MLRVLLALSVTLVPAAAALAQAGDAGWPARQIKLIIPFTAGSSSDAVGRVLGQKLGERLGQSIVVENRVGASGNLGTEAVARSEPDGYTLGLANTSTHAVAPSLTAGLRYDPVKDFTHISMLGDSPFVMLIYPGLEAKTLQDLVATAKANPKKYNYASAGPASMSHLAGALFEKVAGVELVHVAYRGTGQSVIDLMTGRIEIVFATIPPSLQLINEGKVRAVAVTGAKRSDTMPSVPTVAELGHKGYEASLWQAVVAPARLPPAIARRLNSEIRAVLSDPPTNRLLTTQGVEVEASSPEQLEQRIKTDIAKWRDVIKAANITVPPETPATKDDKR